MPSIDELDQVAASLRAAELNTRPIDPPSSASPDLSVGDAYDIQQRNISVRVSDGNVVRGYKVGLTSRAMRESLGVDEPDFGHLLSDMLLDEHQAVATRRLCAPRAEAEIAFLLGADLPTAGCTALDVLAATTCVAPALEIIDSRVVDWRLTLPDTVADNASSAYAVLGGRVGDPRRLDLRTLGFVLRRNGQVVATGAGGAVLGHPAAAVAWLANTLARLGTRLRAGQVVLSGSPTTAVPVAAGDIVTADLHGLGAVTARFS